MYISSRPVKEKLKQEIGHWEGDTVESKGTDFSKISEREILKVQDLLNNIIEE